METIEELKDKIDKLQIELSEANELIKDNKVDIDNLKYEVESQQDDIEEKDLEISELQEKVDSLPNLSLLVDAEKFGLFCENFNKISLEKLEQFIKTL